MSGGVTIVMPRWAEPDDYAEATAVMAVEMLVGEQSENHLAASFYELAAARGHTGAMVALGNLALRAAEDNALLLASLPRSAPGLDGAITTAAGLGRWGGGRWSQEEAAAAAGRRLALEWYSAAAYDVPAPHGDALFNLGQLYFTGRAGVCTVDLSRAVRCFEKAAAPASWSFSPSGMFNTGGCNDSSAQYFLAHLLRCDDDVQVMLQQLGGGGDGDQADFSNYRIDEPRSRPSDWLRLLQAAVAQGHGGAAYYLALLYRNGVADGDDGNGDGDAGDDEGAEEESLLEQLNEPWRRGFELRRSWKHYQRLLRFAADECGDRDALFCLADCYFNGSDGFDVKHFRPPAVSDAVLDAGQIQKQRAQELQQQGGSSSSSSLMLLPKRTAQPDLDGRSKALSYWLAAAEQGHADAMCCLGAVYYRGLCGTATVQPSEARRFQVAFEWYQRAADAAHLEGGPSFSALGWQAEKQQQLTKGQQQDSKETGEAGVDEEGLLSTEKQGEWAGAHREAWGNLASMYALGHGVPKCTKTAKLILRFLEVP